MKTIKKIPYGICFIFLCSLIPLFSLLHSGFPITHDGIDHVARIANFYNGLSEGIIFPRWAENLNWGYGHPILMFLYPLSSYLSSLFHFLGFSYIDSLKIVFAAAYVSSGVTMYFWARKQFNEYMGVACAILYLYSPYRFIDLYVRGAVGEHVAFIFPPLILYCILNYFEAKKTSQKVFSFAAVAISFGLILLAHNAISLMFIPIFIIYPLFLAKSRKNLLGVYAAFFYGLVISAFFTVPAFLEGKFTLRDIVIGNEYMYRFVSNPLTLLYGKWNYGITGQFSVQIGILNILGILFFPYVLFKLKKNKLAKRLLLFFFIAFLIAIFLVLPQSNFLYQVLTTLKKFQFPWRFLSVSTFALSIITSSIFLVIDKKYQKLGLIVFISLLIVISFPFFQAKGYFQKPDSFFNTIYYGSTDTGESAPIWSIRFMEHEPKGHIEKITGEASFVEKERESTHHIYIVNVGSSGARIQENTLYFPGWKVLVDGALVPIQFQDPAHRGLLTFEVPSGQHKIDVVFGDTKLRTISNILSVLSFVLLLLSVILVRIKYKHEKK